MVIGKPAPFVSAFVDAVDAAIRTHQPQHALSGGCVANFAQEVVKGQLPLSVEGLRSQGVE
jgi:hypothetical protein